MSFRTRMRPPSSRNNPERSGERCVGFPFARTDDLPKTALALSPSALRPFFFETVQRGRLTFLEQKENITPEPQFPEPSDVLEFTAERARGHRAGGSGRAGDRCVRGRHAIRHPRADRCQRLSGIGGLRADEGGFASVRARKISLLLWLKIFGWRGRRAC